MAVAYVEEGGAPMAVPGRRHVPPGAPAGLAERELFAVDAYLRAFDSAVEAVDVEQRRVALRRTAFYPGGGGQPSDVGTLRWDGGGAAVTRSAKVRLTGPKARARARAATAVTVTGTGDRVLPDGRLHG
jgi:Ser-tRNA(Ala) deacylase AlaX